MKENNYVTPSQKTQLYALPGNPIIACLFARDTKTIKENPFFSGIAQSFEQMTQELGFITQHYFTTFDIYENDLDKLFSDNITGLLIIGRHKTDIIQRLYPRIKNIVYAGLMPPVSDIYDSVTCDAYRIGITATEYLISKGYDKIGFLGETDDEIRYQGYIDTLKKHDMTINRDWIENIHASMENGYIGMEKIISKRNRPKAIFCMNDYLAIGALKALQDHQLRVPHDMAIIGVDNIEAGKYSTPKLTSINTPMNDLGKIAAKVLIDKIQGGHSIALNVTLPFYIQERESV